jgi:hypothetical protein
VDVAVEGGGGRAGDGGDEEGSGGELHCVDEFGVGS